MYRGRKIETIFKKIISFWNFERIFQNYQSYL